VFVGNQNMVSNLRNIVDDSSELFGRIKQGYGRGTAQDIIRARKKARLWVLDEFGLEHCTDDTFLQLTGILTAREGKATAITCNVPRDRITSRASAGLADRVQSRFGERNFITVQMRGEDQRLVRADSA